MNILKNWLKKIICAAAAASLMPCTVLAYTDVSEDSGYYSAVERLSELGIVSGYEDGLDESTLTEIAADYDVLENGGSLLEQEQETEDSSGPFYLHSFADWLYSDD